MQLPLQVSFHNVDSSAALRDDIEERAALLDQFCPDIMSCRVVVDMPHRHRQSGNLYHVRIDLTAPGEEIVVNREPSEHQSCQDIEAAIGEAFDTATRLVEEYVRRRRGLVKRHEPPLRGRISKLFAEGGYGFLETPDGREIYFHANSVLGSDFERLTIGAPVTFVEELGEKGAQASTVHVEE